MGKMRWYAVQGRAILGSQGHYAGRLADGTEIEVRPDVYRRHRQRYLRSCGMNETTYAEIMGRAKTEWNDSCQWMETSDDKSDYWRQEALRKQAISAKIMNWAKAEWTVSCPAVETCDENCEQWQQEAQTSDRKEPTYAEIMGQAKAEWTAYCQIMNTFDENCEQWRQEAQTPGGVLLPPPHWEPGSGRNAMPDYELVTTLPSEPGRREQ